MLLACFLPQASPRIPPHNITFATATSISAMAEEINGESTTEAAPARNKRSLFSTANWAKPTEHKEGIDFFSRAQELYPIRVAEEERKRQKKIMKQERQASIISAERKPSMTPESKRRRISHADERDGHSSDSSHHHEQDDFPLKRRQVESIAHTDHILTEVLGSLHYQRLAVESHLHIIGRKHLRPPSPEDIAEIYIRRSRNRSEVRLLQRRTSL
jgi:hypothetical protein